MKFCEKCSVEIDTRDGENKCADCENKAIKSAKAKASRQARESALRSCGLVKVRGAMGGVYWE